MKILPSILLRLIYKSFVPKVSTMDASTVEPKHINVLETHLELEKLC
jgi:hypothetical protein